MCDVRGSEKKNKAEQRTARQKPRKGPITRQGKGTSVVAYFAPPARRQAEPPSESGPSPTAFAHASGWPQPSAGHAGTFRCAWCSSADSKSRRCRLGQRRWETEKQGGGEGVCHGQRATRRRARIAKSKSKEHKKGEGCVCAPAERPIANLSSSGCSPSMMAGNSVLIDGRLPGDDPSDDEAAEFIPLPSGVSPSLLDDPTSYPHRRRRTRIG